jgi:putative tryptophan/tyrosine transport system substrate-binding protein
MNRRKFTALLVAASLARSKLAQTQQVQAAGPKGANHRISPSGIFRSRIPVFDALREGLRDDGHVEGATVKVEARWARGKPEILPQLTQELIELGALQWLVPR